MLFTSMLKTTKNIELIQKPKKAKNQVGINNKIDNNEVIN